MAIKILLADDSITIQKVIGIIFGGEEYSLTVVDNGTAAVAKAREITPDILLIDVHMPGISGYEVCEAVRAIPALAVTPILLLTGSFEPFDEEKARSCGADDFIAKPFESQLVISKVKKLCATSAVRTSQPTAIELQAKVPPKTATAPDDIWSAFTSAVEPEMTPASSLPSAGSIIEPQIPDNNSMDDIQDVGALGQNAPFDENAFDFSYKEIGNKTAEPAPVPVTLTEEQLRAAIAGVSREVIERIVWEVVPDLAETLIRDAIRKIREGA